MQHDDPAHFEVLSELRRRVIETYGEERAAEVRLEAALEAAASAIWRVQQEPLEPGEAQP